MHIYFKKVFVVWKLSFIFAVKLWNFMFSKIVKSSLVFVLDTGDCKRATPLCFFLTENQALTKEYRTTFRLISNIGMGGKNSKMSLFYSTFIPLLFQSIWEM